MPTSDQMRQIYQMKDYLDRVNTVISQLTESGLEVRVNVFDFETMVRGTQKKIVIEVYEKIGS